MEGLKCPKCGVTEKQHKIGFTKAGRQRYRCYQCKREYSYEPSKWAFNEKRRKEALKMLLNGSTARQVGKYFKMHHSNVLRWAREEAKKGGLKST